MDIIYNIRIIRGGGGGGGGRGKEGGRGEGRENFGWRVLGNYSRTSSVYQAVLP